MRYLLLLAVAYLLFRGVGRLLNTFKVESRTDPEIKGGRSAEKHIEIDEDNVEDAEFKDVD